MSQVQLQVDLANLATEYLSDGTKTSEDYVRAIARHLVITVVDLALDQD